ncbi:ABC transporter permease [Clostridium luticellarii]|jgi:peptide/nickel transport system permease protein|uniref:Putative D,D-dipeptide transport system permease protein DdpB n=1 Tax=Clostridium luticellarii TaxID=1691940 RepID=A0A2T0BHK9_9CLOT|nr:ABC transporter permease [Clostridium luticellarii]MCI1943912.1 ABC transporter permease [Clostridium luticellarii]MCI1967173.1 ABC transporter permease [Clostridium luticellarii]MCI1994540.1 ABC transporter permease [Clostridium luticellarii]MCI2038507.1 ABC transporter permease [Clostridium luticellarii]PRR83355.1 putative D,D-dipeptide transport system permease protein DdpB [Clostridium luticellarii]
MKKIIIKRLLLMILVIFGVSLIVFLLSHVIPGDPARMMAGQRASQDTLMNIRKQLGLDKPLVVQYFIYMKGLLSGNLGTSIRTQQPVISDLAVYFPATLELVLYAFLIALIVGIPLGILTSIKQNTVFDYLGRIFCIGGVSIPAFWGGIILILIFYSKLNLLPSSGRLSLGVTFNANITGLITVDSLLKGNMEVFKDSLRHLILPAIVLSYAQLATITRQVRSSMIEVLNEEYIKTARANGIKEKSLIVFYALRNALVPTITVVGLSLGGLLGGAVVTETVFNWPGMGKYVVDSISFLDFPSIMGFTIIIVIGYVLINLAVDIIYMILNPQIRG